MVCRFIRGKRRVTRCYQLLGALVVPGLRPKISLVPTRVNDTSSALQMFMTGT
jgi:hypothetical protein